MWLWLGTVNWHFFDRVAIFRKGFIFDNEIYSVPKSSGSPLISFKYIVQNLRNIGMSSFTKLPSSSFPTTQGKLYALYYLTRRRINASFKPDLTTESPNH